ncbi:uncharacterized protein J3D65DRAFT_618287 [Phyllosticta citribraziliensis]|uniref:Uncharacterized protein n=1 Tax=Phyllosticta citribraziliensis TaxID=989973 RepID=A0ABR1LVX5_9PEZI
MEMEYIYEQSGEPPRSPPPPYYSSISQRPSRPRSPRMNPAVAVYIPSGAPPRYSCKMSPTIDDAEAEYRRISINSEATLSEEADLSAPRAARLDKLDEFGTSATRSSSADSTTTIYYDARSSLSEPDTEDEPATQHGGGGSLEFPTLSVTVKRYEMLLAAHRSIVECYRLVNDKLESEVLRTRELEVRARRLRLELEEKDRQIAVREARVEALEERLGVEKEAKPAKKERNNLRGETNVAENESIAGTRETLMIEGPRRNLSAYIGVGFSFVLWVVMVRCLCKFLDMVKTPAR